MRPLPVYESNGAAVHYVGTTPNEGLVQLEILKALGCGPHHRVLEIGCGALIAGFPIMQYLEPGGYTGIDPNPWLIGSSLALHEVSAVAREKGPAFYFRDDFRTGRTGRFDFVLSHSILSHVSNQQLTAFLGTVAWSAHTTVASIRLAEGNEFGSPGSTRHGADFTAWQYPGVSWFRREDVFERARQAGLQARIAPEFTKLILAANPHSVHDWLVLDPQR